ncbi:MAG: class II fructose-bisphosphatase [Pseudomonadota bacterium]
MDISLIMHAAEVTDRAARACLGFIGRGDKNAADGAATDAMRAAFNHVPISGVVVIGEGEMDEAPMLYIGEEVGAGGEAVDIAVDPLEGTNLCAKNGPGSMTTLAMAPRGSLLHAPDMYMDKIAIGPGYKDNIIDLDATPAENIIALAKEKNVSPEEINVCMLDRSRHQDIVNSVRSVGAKISFITDGDVGGVINTAEAYTGIDIYIGRGGAPEGVLSAAALKAVGGQMQGRLFYEEDGDYARAEKLGITDHKKKYYLNDMVQKDAIFAATGVTCGNMTSGLIGEGKGYKTETFVADSMTGKIRRIIARA